MNKSNSAGKVDTTKIQEGIINISCHKIKYKENEESDWQIGIVY